MCFDNLIKFCASHHYDITQAIWYQYIYVDVIKKDELKIASLDTSFCHILKSKKIQFKKTNKWEYYKPQYDNQNVIPYHPTLILLWEAHLNILCITASYL